MAERVGFEPTVPAKVQQFSRLPDSTTLAPLRKAKGERIKLKFILCLRSFFLKKVLHQISAIVCQNT